jgi:hypothetical protein
VRGRFRKKNGAARGRKGRSPVLEVGMVNDGGASVRVKLSGGGVGGRRTA